MKLKRYNQFIVASQIFESKDSEEFRKNIESLKLTLAAMFEPLFKKEREIRDFGNQRLLEEGADNLIEVMFELWAFSVENRQDLEDEINQENNKISFRGFGRKQTKIEEPKPITKKISRVIDENDIENLFLETVINSTIKKKTVNRVGK